MRPRPLCLTGPGSFNLKKPEQHGTIIFMHAPFLEPIVLPYNYFLWKRMRIFGCIELCLAATLFLCSQYFPMKRVRHHNRFKRQNPPEEIIF